MYPVYSGETQPAPGDGAEEEQWIDLYAPGGFSYGTRCSAHFPGFPLERCMRRSGHDGTHRFTSSADGASVSW